MSLINDALKRATQSHSSSPTAPASEPHTPMQAVEYRRSGLPWYFFPTLVLILAGACWFIVKGMQASRLRGGAMAVHAREPQPELTPSIHAQAATEMLDAGITAPSANAAYTPTQLPNRNFSLEDPPVTSTAPETTPTVPSANPPKPAYKLQGIFFRTANPSATVNGKNVTWDRSSASVSKLRFRPVGVVVIFAIIACACNSMS